MKEVYQSVGKIENIDGSRLDWMCVNIVLDHDLYSRLGPMPELGIRGAAWATGIGQNGVALVLLILNHVKPFKCGISLREMRPSRGSAAVCIPVGIAATLNMALTFCFFDLTLSAVLAPFSQSIYSGAGVYYKLRHCFIRSQRRGAGECAR